MESRDDLIRSIREVGFYAVPRHTVKDVYPESVICAQRDPKPGPNGVTFWVTRIGDSWYLVGWGGRLWRIPFDVSVSKVCIDYLTTGTDICAPPDAVSEQYDLVEVNWEDLPYSADDDGALAE